MLKTTVKNAQVYQYFKEHLDADEMATNVKSVYYANKDDIARRFSIATYATFNMHVRKCREYEAQGNTINYIRMDNKGVSDNENNA